MARAMSMMIDVEVDTGRAKAGIKELESTEAKIPLTLEAKQARRQAESTLALVDRLDRKTARPKVDGAGIQKAKTQAESLDKTLDKAARARSIEIRGVASAFSAGQGMGSGGIAGIVSGAAGLGGVGSAGIAAAVGGAIAGGIGAAGIGQAVVGSISRAMQGQKLEAFVGRAYGANGDKFTQSAEALADATGFLSDDFMRASLIGKTLVNNYGLQIEQVQKLVSVSADLAATSPYEDIQTVSNAMERLQSAVRGEAEASERLGLTLNDTYMKNMAFGGSLKGTWEKLSDLEKAQYRYQEILNQTKDVMGAAEEDTGLSSQVRKLKEVLADLGKALVEEGGVVEGLTALASGIRAVGEAIPDWLPKTIGWVAGKALPTVAETAARGTPGLGQIVSALSLSKEVSGRGRPAGFYVEKLTDEFGNVAPNGELMVPARQTTIVLQDRTTTGIRVQDARSYEVSNY